MSLNKSRFKQIFKQRTQTYKYMLFMFILVVYIRLKIVSVLFVVDPFLGKLPLRVRYNPYNPLAYLTILIESIIASVVSMNPLHFFRYFAEQCGNLDRAQYLEIKTINRQKERRKNNETSN